MFLPLTLLPKHRQQCSRGSRSARLDSGSGAESTSLGRRSPSSLATDVADSDTRRLNAPESPNAAPVEKKDTVRLGGCVQENIEVRGRKERGETHQHTTSVLLVARPATSMEPGAVPSSRQRAAPWCPARAQDASRTGCVSCSSSPPPQDKPRQNIRCQLPPTPKSHEMFQNLTPRSEINGEKAMDTRPARLLSCARTIWK